MASGQDKSLLLLGKYLSLGLTLPASLVAGYILGAIVEHWIHWPILKAAGILVGMVAGVIKIVQELERDDRKSRAGKRN